MPHPLPLGRARLHSDEPFLIEHALYNWTASLPIGPHPSCWATHLYISGPPSFHHSQTPLFQLSHAPFGDICIVTLLHIPQLCHSPSLWTILLPSRPLSFPPSSWLFLGWLFLVSQSCFLHLPLAHSSSSFLEMAALAQGERCTASLPWWVSGCREASSINKALGRRSCRANTRGRSEYTVRTALKEGREGRRFH